uniref:Uncharacterized protein n=1 Tax=Micrurus surinamensis TaxID=129470 RepID=A0A2D4NYE7_MICSU
MALKSFPFFWMGGGNPFGKPHLCKTAVVTFTVPCEYQPTVITIPTIFDLSRNMLSKFAGKVNHVDWLLNPLVGSFPLDFLPHHSMLLFPEAVLGGTGQPSQIGVYQLQPINKEGEG